MRERNKKEKKRNKKKRKRKKKKKQSEEKIITVNAWTDLETKPVAADLESI